MSEARKIRLSKSEGLAIGMDQGDTRAGREESVQLRAAVDGLSPRRIALVKRAVTEWKRQLFDLTGRNSLLHYRDLKRGTLDLTSGEADAVANLLQGRPVKTSSLFADEDALSDALRRLRAIHDKARENFEERGVETLFLGCGLVGWDNPGVGWEPSAPLLLRRIELRPLGAAQDEFSLALVEEMEVNPILAYTFKSDFACELDSDSLLGRVEGTIDEDWELREAYEWLRRSASRVPGLHVDHRLVLANFSYTKLPMVQDLDNHIEELIAHDLIAAIAGDEEATEAIRSAQPDPKAVPQPDAIPPADEFLVLDADASQSYAINATIAGASLIVRGPPGTGKSQTIANLVGSLMARGKRVLFVAEKRAAIDAVLKRLQEQHLGDLIMDLHGGAASRRALAQAIRQTLDANHAVRPVSREAAQRELLRARNDLNEYVLALHATRDPWGVSVYAARSELLSVQPLARSHFRVRGEALVAFGSASFERSTNDLRSFARLGGLTLRTRGSPWSAATITEQAGVSRAFELVDVLRRRSLPDATGDLERAASETGLPVSPTLSGWKESLTQWSRTELTLTRFLPQVYSTDLERLSQDIARAREGSIARFSAALLSRRYRRARRQLRDLVRTERPRDRDLAEWVRGAADDVRSWREAGGLDVPGSPGNLPNLESAHEEVLGQLAELEQTAGWKPGLASRPSANLLAFLALLASDQATLVSLPELHRLHRELEAVGLGEPLADLSKGQASEEVALQTLRWIWLQSILEHLSLSDPRVGAFSPDVHARVVSEFSASDRAHIETTASRVRRLAAEHATRARDTHRDQEVILSNFAARKRGHMPTRRLIEAAPDLLLALKPCWAMSPLVVSQLLPARPLFDVVVFDEASQITPADAITSILRGRQLVVAGDERQLPPTSFFVSETREDEEEDESFDAPIAAGGAGIESILETLPQLLPSRMLQWHYRSRDERLIAFSNAHFYSRALTTFPGIGGGPCLAHEVAPWEPGQDTNSPSSEVQTVVELIFDHARTRPEQSLGVIAMGIKHANRIEETLRQRLHDDPELSDFFDEAGDEPFFVKNLERVQGDERDAIILSVGYGKNERGQLVYRFGPLLTDGGERRLNVAITRAKVKLTLVSSFTSSDMDPTRLNSEGMKLMRQYLQYVESGGQDLGDVFIEKPVLNPFEIDVRDTLAPHMALVPQYGASGYWIDFAVQHPSQPGHFVLAIECDGASYHSARSARDRDRLREEQLKRLGWRFSRIWSTDWFQNKNAAVERVLAAYREAVDQASSKAVLQSPGTTARPESSGGATASPVSLRAADRPRVPPGYPIGEYPQGSLVLLARWIESDGLLRTEAEVVSEMMRELGFERRGKRIVEVLTGIVRKARRRL